MMDIGMYGNHASHHSTNYQVGDNSSGYAYYPNHYNHHLNHLHHHHMHHNPSAEILTGFSAHNQCSTPPNTTPPASNSSNHSTSIYHPHLYSPAAAEYGITTSNLSPSEHTYYDNDSIQPYYQNQPNSNDSPHSQVISTVLHHPTSSSASSSSELPETTTSHIISSDNGLSYTNLDYMYGQPNAMYLHQADDKSAIPHTYNHSAVVENNGLHAPQHSSPTWHHASQPHSQHPSHHTSTGYLENSVPAHQIGIGQMSCLQNQNSLNALATNTNSVHGRNINASLHSQSDSSQSAVQHNTSPVQTQTTQQPTYKWMQVKRNVPKPQGTSSFMNNKTKHSKYTANWNTKLSK